MLKSKDNDPSNRPADGELLMPSLENDLSLNQGLGLRLIDDEDRRGFPLENPTFLYAGVSVTDPLLSVSEAVRNSCEAAVRIDSSSQVQIDIRQADIRGPELGTCIVDNACGMTRQEMEKWLLRYGSGSKELGKEKNFGVGLKLAAGYHNRVVTVISWCDGKAHKVVFGRKPSGIIGPYSPAKGLGERADVVETSIPQEAISDRGTLVHLSDIEFKPYKILQFLNERFVSFPGRSDTRVQVWQVDKEEFAKRPAMGLLASIRSSALLEQGQPLFGSIIGEHANYHWAILPDQKFVRAQGFARHVFNLKNFYLCWRDECIRSLGAEHGAQALRSHWGIHAGARRVALVVEAKGVNLTTDPSRSSIINWDQTEAEREWRGRMPEELRAFMSQLEEVHFGTDFENNLIRKLLGYLHRSGAEFEGTEVVHPEQEKSEHNEREELQVDTENATDERLDEQGTVVCGEKGDLNQDKNSGLSRNRRRRGYPEVRFVDKAELGGEPLDFMPEIPRLLINIDYKSIRPLLKDKNKMEQAVVKSLIALELNSAIEQYYRLNKSLPSGDDLKPFVTCPSVVVRLCAQDPNRLVGLARQLKIAGNE